VTVEKSICKPNESFLNWWDNGQLLQEFLQLNVVINHALHGLFDGGIIIQTNPLVGNSLAIDERAL
jgi:hypothetical protein